MKTLKIIFKVGEELTHTLSLADPKDGLTKTEVDEVANEIVTDKAILYGGNSVTGVKEAYISQTERIELV